MASINYYIDKIKWQITSGVLESELPDEGYAKAVNIALEELSRYYNATRLVQVTSSSCIDLAKVEEDNDIKISTVSAVYRSRPNGVSADAGASDPMMLSQWNLANNFYNYGTNRWMYNYLAYNTTNQIANTVSTDLDFKEDRLGRKLYVNFSNGTNGELVIEYIPKLNSVDDITGDYWIDILSKLSLAHAKIAIGRIRTRYTQSDALWTQDGETMLAEGTNELNELINRLQSQSSFVYPVD